MPSLGKVGVILAPPLIKAVETSENYVANLEAFVENTFDWYILLYGRFPVLFIYFVETLSMQS